MLQYVSTKGGVAPVDFETAVLRGFAEDGGMFVPQEIPRVSEAQLLEWADLSFNDLAFEILSLYIDNSIIPSIDLKTLIRKSTETFTHPDIIPVLPLDKKSNHFVMELFHGPTLSFKDVAMGFLINTMDYLLERRGESASLLIATTGDTGPAAAYASCGKKTIDCWTLYPRDFISEEQERQMTTLGVPNVHAVAVENCLNGGDDLDIVIAEMFEDHKLVENLRLSSVNSINWCRVMFQAIHYFYGYFQTVEEIDEKIVFSVPTGAFGNLFAGYLAREMGLPVKSFICANNSNATIHRVLETNRFSREKLKQTPSNAIDIALPYNYWRFLYFVSGQDSKTLKMWMSEYQEQGYVEFDEAMMKEIKHGFLSVAVSDDDTLSTIAETYRGADSYLLDPHGAVAVAAAKALIPSFDAGTKVISLLTAHPAKFPNITRKALKLDGDLPPTGMHDSIEEVKDQFQLLRLCDCTKLKTALIHGMTQANAKKN
ncbi:MAG: threonine synthase [Desulforhopalus sp.]|jgi:threonine synthase